jgi:N-acetylneuraminic acid mutarotase
MGNVARCRVLTIAVNVTAGHSRIPMPSTIRRFAVFVILLAVVHPAPAASQAQTFTLTIQLQGPSNGRVGIIPTGTLCDIPGPACVVNIAAGAAVTIVANTPIGSGVPGAFGNGTGSAAGCAKTTCTFTITANSTVTAAFDPANGPFVNVTPTLAGDGQGEIGIDNSRRQNFDPLQQTGTGSTYIAGSTVNVRAVPASESRFSGFSSGTGGAASCGSAATCSFIASANTTFTATFHALTSIAVNPAPTTALFVGRDQVFTAKGTFTNGVTETISSNGLGTWRTRAPMINARFSLAAAAAAGRVYAIGGIVGTSPGAPSSLVEAYDPAANSWSAVASMPTPREALGAAVVGGLIYAVGGNTTGSTPVAAVERYDPSTNAWTSRAPLAAPRRSLTVVALNGTIYAIGGETSAGTVATVEAYDPAANAWSARAPLNTPRKFLAAAAGDGVLYVAGGVGAGGGLASSVEMYDPVANTWTAKAPLPGARSTLAAASADGIIYMLGGDNGGAQSAAAAYEPVHNLWALKAGMPTSRNELAAVSLGGIVYAIGGHSGSAANLNTVEALTDALRWRSSNIAAATVDQGSPDVRVFGVAPGQSDIMASVGALSCGTACGKVSVTRNVITMALDHPSLQFGATKSGTAFTTSTPPQQVRMTQTGVGTVTWTVVVAQPWLRVTPASGTGPTVFSVSVVADPSLPASGTVSGIVSIMLTGADSGVGPISVSLAVQPAGVSAAPFGAIDTPAAGTTGVVGSLPVTGWALDDVGVSQVRITRAAVAGEVPGSEIFLGFASIVEGARPDVAATYPGLPKGTAAGWGYLLLTNFLPNQGNGTVTLNAYADDVDGHSTKLGSRTVTCANAAATTPFGAIDTPGQGDTVSGVVNNFGWVLSPGARRADPPSGGAVTAFIDGLPVGVPSGWASRTDLVALFPSAQYSGVGSALGVFTFDSMALANGVHTIAWSVTDNTGGAAGVGSRYFTVSNGGLMLGPSQNSVETTRSPTVIDSRATLEMPRAAALRLDSPQSLAAEVDAVTADAVTLHGRRGFDLASPLRDYAVERGGATVQAEELDRVELHLSGTGGHRYTGYLRTPDGVAPLPVGSTLDAATGAFVWMPGPGFVGPYDLAFVRWSRGRAVARQDVRIVLSAKGSNRVGPQTIIDLPGADRVFRSGEPIFLGGWAADLDAPFDSGVDTVHVWAYPVNGAGAWDAPMWIGAASYGGARPDVGEIYGDRFTNSGYGLLVRDLAPGTYDLAVFAYSTVQNGFAPARLVRVTVR